jgi:hypothetical protein
MITDWQEINLTKIKHLTSAEPLPMITVAEKLNLSIDTMRNWKHCGLLKTEKRYEMREHKNKARHWEQRHKMIFVTGVRL